MVCRRMCLIVLCCIFGKLLFGQDVNISFSHIYSQNGLLTNQVNDIIRDSHGFWWIASHSGLSRYDGSNFKHFKKIDNDSTSLLSDRVSWIYEDPSRRLWVMTIEGMCVFDPSSERFSHNLTSIFEELKIPAGTVEQLLTDSVGNFWMLHSEGLYMYNPATRTTAHVDAVQKEEIAAMCEGHHGAMWIVCRNGTFARIDKNLKIGYVNDQLSSEHTNEDFEIMADQDGDLWIYSASSNSGVYFFDSGSGSILPINTKSRDVKLNSDIVRDVGVGENGWIWICTDHGGINLINKKTWKAIYLTHDPLDARSLSGNTATFIYKDSDDVMWIGVYNRGLNFYHKNLNQFTRYQKSSLDPTSLPFNDVNEFAEDSKGNLWIGTNGGGLVYFDRENKSFRQYLHDPKNPASLCSNVIVSLYVDQSDHLWIGTFFGGLDYFDGSTFTHFKHTNSNQNQISDNSVWDITGDQEGNIWIGTLRGYLNKYEPHTNEFSYYGPDQVIYSPYVTSVLQDTHGSIWVGTGYGLSVREKGATKFSLFQRGTGKGSLSSNHITCLYEDTNIGVMWIGTQDGLNVYDRNTKTFRHLRTEDGLPDNDIMGVVVDDDGKVWITTTKGVSLLTIENMKSRPDSLVVKVSTFDETDGLQSGQFQRGAVIKTLDGHLFFGGTDGFNEFTPSKIIEREHVPKVILSKLLIDNNEVKAGKLVNGHEILTKAITETDKITLAPGYHSFSLEFSLLTLLNNSKIRCRYKLVGFDNDWVEAKSQVRSAHYTSIDAGTYKFFVSISVNDGAWHDGVETLVIEVLPPIWRSDIAIFIYIVMGLVAAFFARHFLLVRERARYEKEKEHEEKQRALEMDRLKIKFITNVSHEFRTPLSLILTPIESLLRQSQKNVMVARDNLQLIHRNAKRLLNLVNQLLDFRRLESEEVKLHASEGDIVHFIKEVANSFSDLAERKKIVFSIESTVPEVTTLFDSNKLERILFNLISNAFKFTREGGSVSIKLGCEVSHDRKLLRIDVKDSGIGIAVEHRDKIFDRFFQSDLPSNMLNEGSGIGLSITREFVRLHGGEIAVTSEVNKGSCFTVLLPIQRQADDEKIETYEAIGASEETEHFADPPHRKGKRILLLVEDNDDFRFYLKDNLKYLYQIEEASNGSEGWRKALELLPDLIVSDIMMPVMTGIDLCSRIKADKRTSHIPVILLTARSSDEQRLEGLQVEADDYVVKPFNFEILQARIRSLISLRVKFHKNFQQNYEIRSTEINISSLDQKLLEKAIKIVEEHMSDPDFSVETLCKELGISRAHLYRKLLSITGKSAIEFIRVIKLQRAAQLLERSQLTVAEIAYEVGFGHPKYFTKYFKEHYHMVPSAYARKHNKSSA
jgi:signal transduction histidine kinase/ligand-binding sensor domain-containing protein/DNA-binding response OmpR family regulator